MTKSNLIYLYFFSLFIIFSCGKNNENYTDNLPSEPDFDSTLIKVKDSSNGVVIFEKPIDSLALREAEEKKLLEENVKKEKIEKENKEKTEKIEKENKEKTEKNQHVEPISSE